MEQHVLVLPLSAGIVATKYVLPRADTYLDITPLASASDVLRNLAAFKATSNLISQKLLNYTLHFLVITKIAIACDDIVLERKTFL